MSSKATVKMKEKKKRQLEELIQRKNAASISEEEPVVEDLDSGIVTNVDIIQNFDELTEEDLKKMLKSELIEIAEALELNTSGSRNELIERILNEEE